MGYDYHGVKGEALTEIVGSHPGLSLGKLPKTFDHRYLAEDVPFGLLPLIEILERYEIPCPVNKAVAALPLLPVGGRLVERCLSPSASASGHGLAMTILSKDTLI